MLSRIIEAERLLKSCLCSCELAKITKSESKRSLCLQQKTAVICQFCPFDEAFAELLRPFQLTSDDAERPETIERSKEQVMLTKLFAQFACAGEYLFDLWRGIAFRDE